LTGTTLIDPVRRFRRSARPGQWSWPGRMPLTGRASRRGRRRNPGRTEALAVERDKLGVIVEDRLPW